ncbi:uncharacterized protein CBL_11089 [Carabus blaptoides fortunei]
MEETASGNQQAFDEIYSLYDISKAEQKNCRDDGDKINSLYFEPVLASVDRVLQDVGKDTEDYMTLLAMKASLYYEQAKVLQIREQIPFALETMKNGLALVEEHRLHPLVTYQYYRLLNHHAYQLSRTDGIEEALKILEEAEQLYYGLTTKADMLVYSTDDLFKRECEPRHVHNIGKFEKLVTNNLQIQGWIYNKQGLTDKFIVYHHRVLNRQLESQDGEGFAWVFKCARLASHFISLHKFSEARYHLGAAVAVLRECERDLYRFQRNIDVDSIHRAYADLGKHWIKYGLWLFDSASKRVRDTDATLDRLLITSFTDDCKQTTAAAATQTGITADEQLLTETDVNTASGGDEQQALDTEVAATHDGEEEQHYPETIDKYIFVFPSLTVADIEVQVPDTVSTTEEARRLFLYSQEWLRRAKAYYTLRDHPAEYVSLVFELSDLYRYMAMHEPEVDSQYGVHRRRCDILDALYDMLREVQPINYTATCIEVFRELTQVQLDLLAYNLRRLQTCSETNSVTHVSQQYEALANVHQRLDKYIQVRPDQPAENVMII